jgi:hypothetical protein
MTTTLTQVNRTTETISINSKLKIVKLSDQKFSHPAGYVMYKGFALYHPTLGFFGFKGDGKPYTPVGGKKALQSILNDGGLLSFDDSIWFLSIN